MLKKMAGFFVIISIFVFQLAVARAADPDSVPPTPNVAEEKIQKLEAEFQRLTDELAAVEKAAQARISELEDEVRYLQGVLSDIRARVGNNVAGPSAASEPHNYVE